jgi:hypothetical protein
MDDASSMSGPVTDSSVPKPTAGSSNTSIAACDTAPNTNAAVMKE